MRTLFYLLLLLPLACCKSADECTNDFADPRLMRIADLQDRRLADSLYLFFHHEDPLYRRNAVRAFGSVQEPNAVDKIGKLLLMDADPSVRKAAAFALGQIEHPTTPHLDGRYTIFAVVTEGMRVMDYIQVSDKILDVEVENFTTQ